MKRRSELSGGEVDALVQGLSDRLAQVALATQPEVAAKILRLVTKGEAGIADFAKVIRNDAALSGRMLRLVNSAFFAQREPVTTVDRACVLLGLDRLKALSLGFYLSRSLADKKDVMSRRVWGQGIYRGTLASELAMRMCPRRSAEAFVIGLMVDSGIPLMPRLIGERYDAIASREMTPARTFRTEFEELEFTHVDVAAALARLWKLPEILAKPLEWHHTRPSVDASTSDLQALHRLAYYVGAVDLDARAHVPRDGVPMPTVAMAMLGLDTERLRESVERAGREYGAILSTFAEVADALTNVEALGQRVHHEIVELVERSVLEAPLIGDIVGGVESHRLTVNGQEVEVERGADGVTTAYLYDSRGSKLVSYKFKPAEETSSSLLTQLGLEGAPADSLDRLRAVLTRLAA